MNKIVSKRLAAYIVDMLLISLVSMIITIIPFINSNQANYEKTKNRIEELNEKYEDKKIDRKEYKDSIVALNKKLDIYSFPITVVTLTCIFGYFVMFQYYNNGQTVGKKLMKIRVRSMNDKNPTFISYLIRGLILNSILINLISVISLFITSNYTYYYLTYALGLIDTLIVFTTIGVIMFKNSNRSLHDIIAKTKVVFDDDSKIIES